MKKSITNKYRQKPQKLSYWEFMKINWRQQLTRPSHLLGIVLAINSLCLEAAEIVAEENKSSSDNILNLKSLETNNLGSGSAELSPNIVRPFNKIINLPKNGKIWATEDPSLLVPTLSVSSPGSVAFVDGKIAEPILFNIYTNYAPFIVKAEISVYGPDDIYKTTPIAVIPVRWSSNISVTTTEWLGELSRKIKLKENETLSYNIKVYGKDGSWDETNYKKIRLLSLANREKEKNNLKSNTSLSVLNQANQSIGGSLENFIVEREQYGANELLIQNIAVSGSRVRLRGNNIADGYTLNIDGNWVPIDEKGQFIADFILPVGNHKFDVIIRKPDDKESINTTLDLNVTGKYFFLVGLADLTFSDTRVSGNVTAISPIDRERFDYVQSDGRLAFYLKGKIQGKYLITAQVDTRENKLDELFTGFLQADPTDVFRRIDPDAYYPVYGDDSTVIRDANTQGRLYVRLDWDKNQVLVGTYTVNLDSAQLSQFNRTLYGGKAQLQSKEITDLGQPRSALQIFGSEQQTAPGRSEFLGTGGSFYYLRDTDILAGSEQISVLIRDKDSGRVLSETRLVAGRDYEMDAFQGRLTLTRPLQQIVRDNNIVVDSPNSGNSQTLNVNYEYFPPQFDTGNLVTGAQGKQWIGDHLAIGGTYVDDKRGGNDYSLRGVDITLQKSKGTYLKLENANSTSLSANIFYSDNGGLSFFQVPNGPQLTGQANSLEAHIDLKESGITDNEATVKGWYLNRDSSFSNSRIDNFGYDILDKGIEGRMQLSEDVKVTADYHDLNRSSLTDQQGLKRARVNSLWNYSANNSISTELQRAEENNAGSLSTASLAGVRFNNQITPNISAYAGGQAAFDRINYADNNAYMVGAAYAFENLSTVGVDYINGDRGSMLSASGEYRATENYTVYSSYTYQPEGGNSNDLFSNNSYFQKADGLTLGQRWQLNDRVRLVNEGQWIKDVNQEGVVNNLGLDYLPSKGWNVGFNVQLGTLTSINTGQLTQREAYSVNAGFTNQQMEWNSKLEHRTDTGSENREQWVTTNRAGYKVSEDWRVLGRVNYSQTNNTQADSLEAEVIDLGVGLDYRPLGGKWNVLGKYTYYYNLASPGQSGGNNFDQRSQIISSEGTYEFDQYWEYAAKLAYRISEARVDPGVGDWYNNTATFAAIQTRYHIGDRGNFENLWNGWSSLLELRALKVVGDGVRSGILTSLDKDVNKYLKMGIGYNFTDFSSDMTDLNYNHKGWFFNILGRF
jgi:hypothetical protein